MGINTGHVHTTDFMLEEADRDFVVQVIVEDLCPIVYVISWSQIT